MYVQNKNPIENLQCRNQLQFWHIVMGVVSPNGNMTFHILL